MKKQIIHRLCAVLAAVLILISVLPSVSAGSSVPVIKVSGTGKVHYYPDSDDLGTTLLNMQILHFGKAREVNGTLFYDPEVLTLQFCSTDFVDAASFDAETPGRVDVRVKNPDTIDKEGVGIIRFSFAVNKEGDFGFSVVPGFWVGEYGGVGQAKAELTLQADTPTVVARITDGKNEYGGFADATIIIYNFDASKEVDFTLFYDPDVVEPDVATETPLFLWSTEEAVPGRLFFRVYQQGSNDFGNLYVTNYTFRIKGEGDFGFSLLPGIWVDENGDFGRAKGELYDRDVLLPPRVNEAPTQDSGELRGIFAFVDPNAERHQSYSSSYFGVEELTKEKWATDMLVEKGDELQPLVRFSPKTPADAKALYEALHSHPDVTRVVAEGWVGDSVYLLGDVDGDFSLTAADARLALRQAVALEELSLLSRAAADMDLDGEITAADARLILRAAVGLK